MSEERILMGGNDACAEGAIQAGCRFYAGYPITPQNELTAYMSRRMIELDGVFIQSESELAAINMVFGASVAGARAMTSSSSPGISLKQEGISYLAGCELPAVIANIMRGGPGLGNIAPSQADYFQATKGGGHGDYYTPVLAPATVQEMMDFTFKAFDLADKYRTPVMVLADGMLGQMMEPVIIGHKVSSRYEKPWALTGCKGRKPNIIRSLYLKDGALEELNKRLQKRYETIKKDEVMCEELFVDEGQVVLVAYGTCARIAKSVVTDLRKQGKKVGLLRPMTLWPFPEEAVRRAAAKAKTILTIEMSMGQMVEDVRLAAGNSCSVEFYGRTGGIVPQEEDIYKTVERMLKSIS